MSQESARSDRELERAELRGITRSIATVEWLLLALMVLFLFGTSSESVGEPPVLMSLIAFGFLALLFWTVPLLRERTRVTMTIRTLAMVAVLTVILSQTEGSMSSLTVLYILPIVTAALALGKRATVLAALLVTACYFTLAFEQGGSATLSPASASHAAITLLPLYLVAFLVSTLADNVRIAKRRIHRLADQDEATGVYNIGAFFRLAETEHTRAMRVAEPYSILKIDLDNLRGINDTYGHEAGNRALKMVAEALVRVTRGEDIVARSGSDEFVAFLPDTETGAAQEIAQRIRNVVYSSTLDVEVKMVRISASVGTASYSQDGSSLEALMRSADLSLMTEKELRTVPDDALVVQKK